MKHRQNKLLSDYEKGNLTDDHLSLKLAQLEERKEKLELKPTIPESLTNLIDLNLLIDNNPTLAQYTLYQSIIDRIEVDEDKKVTAIYLNGFSENILKELQEDVN